MPAARRVSATLDMNAELRSEPNVSRRIDAGRRLSAAVRADEYFLLARAKSPRCWENSSKVQRRPAGQGGRRKLDDEFVWRERRRQRGEDEVRRADDARTRGAAHMDLGLAGYGDAGHLGGRVRVGGAAPHGAAVSDLVMGDMRNGGHEQGLCASQPRVALDIAPAHLGAEAHPFLADRDMTKTLQLAQVHEGAGRGDPEGQHIRLCPPAIGLASPS